MLISNNSIFSSVLAGYSIPRTVQRQLKQAETGTPVADIVRKLEISEQTFYRWKKKYSGLLPSELKRLRQLEDENKRLKQMVAELSLDKKMLQEVLSKKV